MSFRRCKSTLRSRINNALGACQEATVRTPDEQY